MHIGIGLPAGMPNVSGQLVLDWARQADTAGFYSLGIIDRVVYFNYEPMIALAAAAAVTQRARLITVILIATLRNAGILAKQAASIDALSNGRLTLGLAVGGREDDFRAAPAPFERRGPRFAAQLALIRRVWSGQGAVEGDGAVGPSVVQPGGPPIFIGAISPPALRRAGRLGDGFLSGPRDTNEMVVAYQTVEAAWQAAGRPGKPRFAAIRYYALGPDAHDRGADYLSHYYARPLMNPERQIRLLVTSADAIRRVNQEFEAIGGEELVWLPSIPQLDQVDRLKDVLA
jgi:alkanesulfonate monooxygenase SsuD/methylene tetrahydromethanopterin reductase-like flavin-dependent oxidoreductase (luciferase family)